MDEPEANGALKFDFDGNAVELTKEDLLITAAQVEGFPSETDNGITVVLDTRLSEELIKEEVLADDVLENTDFQDAKEWNINGEKVKIGVEKI